MHKILTLNHISIKGLERFSLEHYEIASEIGNPDAILVRSHVIPEESIEPSLKAIARAGAGVNNIPVSYCTNKGIPVFNTPGANANAVKELVLTAFLLSSRGILNGIRFVENLDISDSKEMTKIVEKEKKNYSGQEIAGKSLGVVGLGAIGSMVADVGIKMGMRVFGYDPGLSVEAAWRLSSHIRRMENLPSLLAKSDYVSLHLPMIDKTKHTINNETICFFKEGARLFNFSRGGIVDSSAILSGIENKRIACYATDFPDPLFMGKKEVIQIPHLGASTVEAEDNCAVMAADELIDFLENGNIKNSVNFPDLKLERASGYRIAIANKNVPKVLGNILAILAEKNINVNDMLNKSRDEIAYNLIDISSQPTTSLLSIIENVEGVINVRCI